MTMKTTKRPSAAMAMKTMPPVDLNHVHAVSAEMNGFESDFEESAAGPAAGPELEDPVPELELELPLQRSEVDCNGLCWGTELLQSDLPMAFRGRRAVAGLRVGRDPWDLLDEARRQIFFFCGSIEVDEIFVEGFFASAVCGRRRVVPFSTLARIHRIRVV
eukprot:tig00000190_g13853.t1